ncbi:MAG: carboxypeptidase regulatory-like domain-containing protein [Halanaeroarchaeum sp.]
MFDTFRRDERAIEGLPIRLVIAFVVGVASLSLMLSMLSGVQSFGVSELDAKPSPSVLSPGQHQVSIEAIDSEGDPVAGATVLVKRGSATIDGVAVGKTGPNGVARFDVSPRLGPNQAEGTLTIEVKPPAGSQYMDRRENAEILVVRGA